MKSKLDEQKKIILIYCGELLFFSIIFLVLGILRIKGIIQYNEKRRIIFNYITLVGFVWGTYDFLSTSLNKKKRQKNCLLDKCLVLPLSIYLLVFDLICLFGSSNKSQNFYVYGVAVVFFYGFLIYLFQAIYHYFYPIPMLLEEDEKEKETSGN